ncbi:MAG: hypothetical protein GC191_10190 [Azospirillum sp.]|nr:hypothetical protein [Azospirillum sp.]
MAEGPDERRDAAKPKKSVASSGDADPKRLLWLPGVGVALITVIAVFGVWKPEQTRGLVAKLTGLDRPGEPVLVELDPMPLPMADADGVRVRSGPMTIVLKVRDQDAASRTRTLTPRLRDRLLSDFNERAIAGKPLSLTPTGIRETNRQITAIARSVIGTDEIDQALVVTPIAKINW